MKSLMWGKILETVCNAHSLWTIRRKEHNLWTILTGSSRGPKTIQGWVGSYTHYHQRRLAREAPLTGVCLVTAKRSEVKTPLPIPRQWSYSRSLDRLPHITTQFGRISSQPSEKNIHWNIGRHLLLRLHTSRGHKQATVPTKEGIFTMLVLHFIV